MSGISDFMSSVGGGGASPVLGTHTWTDSTLTLDLSTGNVFYVADTDGKYPLSIDFVNPPSSGTIGTYDILMVNSRDNIGGYLGDYNYIATYPEDFGRDYTASNYDGRRSLAFDNSTNKYISYQSNDIYYTNGDTEDQLGYRTSTSSDSTLSNRLPTSTYASGGRMSPDGTKVIFGSTSSGMQSFELATPFDFYSTKSNIHTNNNSQWDVYYETGPMVSPDGTLVTFQSSGGMYTADMSIPWDVDTLANRGGGSINTSSYRCWGYINNGRSLVGSNAGTNIIYFTTLNTPYDLRGGYTTEPTAHSLPQVGLLSGVTDTYIRTGIVTDANIAWGVLYTTVSGTGRYNWMKFDWNGSYASTWPSNVSTPTHSVTEPGKGQGKHYRLTTADGGASYIVVDI
jgi:hypothetical protein